MPKSDASSTATRFCSRGSASACLAPSARDSCELYSDDPGVDPYTRVVSDVYQDLFGEGSFIGKGIYDVDSFEQLLRRLSRQRDSQPRLDRGSVLPLGLAQRCDAVRRASLALRGRYRPPASLDARRLADCRVAASHGSAARSGQRVRNPISALSRWKIFDNLRRSLVPIAMLLRAARLLVRLAGAGAARCCLLGERGLAADADWRGGGPASQAGRFAAAACIWRVTLQSLGRPLAQNALSLVFLPYEAYICGDAIVRTLLRMLWTQTATAGMEDCQRFGTRRRPALWQRRSARWRLLPRWPRRRSWQSSSTSPRCCPSRRPWLAAWLVSPLVAWWLSQPIPKRALQLSERQRQFLEKLSRKTWRYFEEFVTAEENWLPPDNIQQNPDLVVAPRTSPTNIGMALLGGPGRLRLRLLLGGAVARAHAAHV